MAGKKKAPEKWPKEMHGNRCGYKLHEDGSITPAPLYYDPLVKAIREWGALLDMQNAMVDHMARMVQNKANEIGEIWSRIYEDYELDPEVRYSLKVFERRLVPTDLPPRKGTKAPRFVYEDGEEET